MKWLAALPVGSQRIDVHLLPANDSRLEGNDALYDPEKSVIYLSKTLSPSNRNEKLFHELDHAVNEASGANQLLKDSVKAPRKRGPAIDSTLFQLEENLVRARASCWPNLLIALGFQFPKGPTE